MLIHCIDSQSILYTTGADYVVEDVIKSDNRTFYMITNDRGCADIVCCQIGACSCATWELV